MKLKLNKTGSLQLSINAIVVLILAITILGLGLGFIKTQFGAMEEQFTTVSDEIKNDLIDKIKTSGELLAFNKIDMKAITGKPEDFYIGIKNTDSTTKCFMMNFTCIRGKSTGQPSYCTDTDIGSNSTTNTDWFTTFFEKDVDGGQVDVVPIRLLVSSGVAADTYLAKVNLNKGNDTCGAPNLDYSLYKSKQFYVEITS
jgi:hypothetical protein